MCPKNLSAQNNPRVVSSELENSTDLRGQKGKIHGLLSRFIAQSRFWALMTKYNDRVTYLHQNTIPLGIVLKHILCECTRFFLVLTCNCSVFVNMSA